ncbi:GIY-YIG_COG3680 domain containing protein [uncultured Caudovirales phage]|uniref:GIY-YIG_COG3680 domain containing protein n=1 Tax=uncultured Caudovirales phage TaxID=2100421 RepID=A0A6J5T6U8_9CAUD|nr:GIY-YIG_COG3680 domain containing protein [uncultured Caudovirales phage]
MELVKENKYYVYALIDPINRLPFYIGKGCGNRAWSHLKNEKTNIEKVRIIGLIRSLNLEPEVKLITSDLEETLAYQLETLFIDYSKSIGIKLVNVFSKATPPSRRGCIVSDITKQKISNTTKGRKGTPMTDIAKLKLSIANTGKQGPNKAFVDIVNLHNLYVIENKTKKEICDIFNIGMGSLNRILNENSIQKTIDCFSKFGQKRHNNSIKSLTYK